MPKSRPIIFNSESVRAVLENRKTQSRRVMKHQPSDWATNIFLGPYIGENFTYGKEGYWLQASDDYYRIHGLGKCPYGVPGDKLWVRETWRKPEHGKVGGLPVYFMSIGNYYCKVEYKADNSARNIESQTAVSIDSDGKWKSPIFMPKVFSRITLEIKDVRVERIQDISPSDCIAEGLDSKLTDIGARYSFGILWNSINAKKGFGWDTNPWVWVLEFERSNDG